MTTEAISIRDATAADAADLLAIYAPFVRDTAVSFEVEPPGAVEFAARIEASLARWAWLVAERGGRAVGYAYAGEHRVRGAYRYSVETSVYLDAAHRGDGLGSQLYRALLPRLAARGLCNAYAGITLPNEASVRLHERIGFEAIGVFRRVGWKFGAWHDVGWWHLPLREAPPQDSEGRDPS
jgi:phosphinothricin acetyltransferase